MKYDFTRCNNLNLKVKDKKGKVREGFLKVSSRGEVYVYYSAENKIFNPFFQIELNSYHEIFTDTTNFDEWAEIHELEIIPRDPETYKDWKVGDSIMSKLNNDEFVIKAILNDLIFVNSTSVVATGLFPSKFIDENYKLVLTDYEQEILKAQDEKKTRECPFQKGDRVLVRDEDESVWFFDIFDRFEEEKDYPYYCSKNVYKHCIPLNEKTWKLLGITDEYKEEE